MLNIINELNLENGSNYKKEVLLKYSDNELFKKILLYTYSNHKYYIKKIPSYTSNVINTSNIDEWQLVFDTLDKLRFREVTGHNAIDLLKDTLETVNSSISVVMELIINKDLRCNISAKTINSVYKKLITETSYQRCSKLDEKTISNINYPAVIQKKCDGLFAYAFKHDNRVQFSTRNGTIFDSNSISYGIDSINENDIVLMGELVIKINNSDLDRKTSNGLVNSYIKRYDTISKLENSSNPKDLLRLESYMEEWEQTDENIVFEVWDIISYEEYLDKKSKDKYIDRYRRLNNLINNQPHIQVIETHIVDTIEEAKTIGQNYINNGYEGAILKDYSSIWKDGTSKQMLKLKNISDCDLKCVGVEEGTGKNEGKVGSLILESSCQKLKTKCGTGLNDEDRNKPFDFYIGKIVEVQYNELIKSKSKDSWSLFLPVFVEVREKEEANSLEDLL